MKINDIQDIEVKQGLPILIELDNFSVPRFIEYYNTNKENIEKILSKRGAIKFSGIAIDSLHSFQEATNGISDNFLDYIDGNSPRTKLQGKVYTSTEYESSQKITMHNELSYSSKWPKKLYFSCIEPSITGGETLLADCRTIVQNMNPSIIEEIESRGITYIRNLHSGQGMGPSWKDTFETEDKNEVEQYCLTAHIKYEWLNDDSLRLYQNSKGIIKHHITGEKVWFNQIDQFHPSHLGTEVFETLQLLYESPKEYPMYVTFGDGKEIHEQMISEIIESIEKETLYPVWQKNELLILDNELVCHGRNSYTGNRLILVTMGN
ncbi:TauD/TfdA family dioxygenase [Aquimarina intermedia]|uniref:TfdA family taurine catabolism dioxygenase TauD n=1 Tax=Aquimarina intermedia TaxID=350814 RepID=A0A5S5C4J0_9FLAO|nr:TauD/TfdA family dioxygenase [Aquimarina intermedia]TYP74345.1 TfdA family taurine catabolism dioxygenase TauD [Aquimarina intermedia]